MRKQGDNAGSIRKRPALSPGSRLGAFMERKRRQPSVAIPIQTRRQKIDETRSIGTPPDAIPTSLNGPPMSSR